MLPFFATGDAFAVDEALKAVSLKRRIKLIGEVQVVATVGDEDAKLALSGESGRLACCGVISPGPGEAGPDASCATSAIARLPSLH